ncbi:carbonic anhydrase 14 isoform 2-T2 [Morphnus guianensis]
MDPPSLPVPLGGAVPGGYLRPDLRHPAPPPPCCVPCCCWGAWPSPCPPVPTGRTRAPMGSSTGPRGTRHAGAEPSHPSTSERGGHSQTPRCHPSAPRANPAPRPSPSPTTATPRCWHCRPPCGYRGCRAASLPLSSTSTGDGPATLVVLNISSTGTVPPPRCMWCTTTRSATPTPARRSTTPAGWLCSVSSWSVQDLLPPRLDLYYRYNGSLTTPPCFQSVLWTLFQQPVRISLAQLEQLQGTLYTTTAAEPEPQRLVDNFRVPQELNQRLVLSSFPRGESQLEAGGGGVGRAPPHPSNGSQSPGWVRGCGTEPPQLFSCRARGVFDRYSPAGGRWGWAGGFTPPQSPLSPLLHHVGEVIAIIFGAVSSCLGLFLALHLVAKRIRARRAQDQDVVFKASSHRTHSDDGPRP